MAVKVSSCSSGLTGKYCFAMSKTRFVCATPKSFFSKYGLANLNNSSVFILTHPLTLCSNLFLLAKFVSKPQRAYVLFKWFFRLTISEGG